MDPILLIYLKFSCARYLFGPKNFDIDFFQRKLWSKIFVLNQYFFRNQQLFWTNIFFRIQQLFYTKLFFYLKFFGRNIFFVPNIFAHKIFLAPILLLAPKLFLDPYFFDPYFFGPKFSFGHKNLHPKNLFWTGKFLDTKIFWPKNLLT